MNEMVERVARAICNAAEDDWDWSVFYIVDSNDTVEMGREVYRDMARAAIEAMRDAPVHIQKVGLQALAKAGAGSPLPGWAASDCWRSMIDAALKD